MIFIFMIFIFICIFMIFIVICISMIFTIIYMYSVRPFGKYARIDSLNESCSLGIGFWFICFFFLVVLTACGFVFVSFCLSPSSVTSSPLLNEVHACVLPGSAVNQFRSNLRSYAVRIFVFESVNAVCIVVSVWVCLRRPFSLPIFNSFWLKQEKGRFYPRLCISLSEHQSEDFHRAQDLPHPRHSFDLPSDLNHHLF